MLLRSVIVLPSSLLRHKHLLVSLRYGTRDFCLCPTSVPSPDPRGVCLLSDSVKSPKCLGEHSFGKLHEVPLRDVAYLTDAPETATSLSVQAPVLHSHADSLGGSSRSWFFSASVSCLILPPPLALPPPLTRPFRPQLSRHFSRDCHWFESLVNHPGAPRHSGSWQPAEGSGRAGHRGDLNDRLVPEGTAGLQKTSRGRWGHQGNHAQL